MSLSGKLLKEAREQRGLSLEQVSSDLKIHVRILQALEEERPDVTVPEAIRRGFLRSYARYLRIEMGDNHTTGKTSEDQEQRAIVSHLSDANSPSREEFKPAKGSRNAVTSDESAETFAWKWVALIIIGVVGVRLFFSFKDETKSSKQSNRVATTGTNLQEESKSSVTSSENLMEVLQESHHVLSLNPSVPSPSLDAVGAISSEVSQSASEPIAQQGSEVLEVVENRTLTQSDSLPHASGDVSFRWLLVSSQTTQTLKLQTLEGERQLALSPQEHYLIKLLLPAQLQWSQPQSLEIVDEARRIKAQSSTSAQIK